MNNKTRVALIFASGVVIATICLALAHFFLSEMIVRNYGELIVLAMICSGGHAVASASKKGTILAKLGTPSLIGLGLTISLHLGWVGLGPAIVICFLDYIPAHIFRNRNVITVKTEEKE